MWPGFPPARLRWLTRRACVHLLPQTHQPQIPSVFLIIPFWHLVLLLKPGSITSSLTFLKVKQAWTLIIQRASFPRRQTSFLHQPVNVYSDLQGWIKLSFRCVPGFLSLTGKDGLSLFQSWVRLKAECRDHLRWGLTYTGKSLSA